jgi:RHS repeat-associated protein
MATKCLSPAVLLGSVFLFTMAGFAQSPSNSHNFGLPDNASFHGSEIDNVQLNNGNLHIEIPLYSVSGRGPAAGFKYVYDSKGWFAYTLNWAAGTPVYIKPMGYGDNGLGARPFQNMGWSVVGPLSNPVAGTNFPGLGFTSEQGYSCIYNGQVYSANRITWIYKEPGGETHAFQKYLTSSLAPCPVPTMVYAVDGSGFALQLNPTVLYAKNGTQIQQTFDGQGNVNGWVVQDTSGNQISKVSSSPAATTITDTLGRSLNSDFIYNSSIGKYELTYYDSSGNPQKIQVVKSSVGLQTNLCSLQNTGSDGPCTEYTASGQVPTEIDLPNGTKYTIVYNQNAYGTPSSITLPSGATISYSWGTTYPSCAASSYGIDDAGPRVVSRTISGAGVPNATWTYTYSCYGGGGKTTVTDANGNDTVHKFDNSSAWQVGAPIKPSYEIETDSYSGSASSGTLLKTVATDYLVLDTVAGTKLPIHKTTTWNAQGSLQQREETDYDSASMNGSTIYWGNPVEIREYGFGAGPYGALARKTHFNYAHLAGNTNYNANYVSLNIANRVTEKQIYDGSGNLLADSKTYYDQNSVTAISGVPNHVTLSTQSRGNPTQSSVWRNTTNTWLSTNNTFNDLGHVLSTQDPLVHTTTFSYADSWSGSTCGVGTNTQAYLTQTSAPNTTNSQGATVHHRAQTSYYPCTGQKQSTRDENDILAARTGTTYTYDLMFRPLTVTRTDGGQTSYSYTDTSGAVSVTTTEKQDSTHNIVSTSYADGLGRLKQTRLTSDPEGTVYTDTTYDLLGRKASVSNPYRSTSDPTYGTAQYQYDPLSRVILEIPPDGSSTSNNVHTSYGAQTTGVLGLSTTVTDQAGKKRMSVTDALGRLVDVWEPDSSGNLVNETAYSYDALNNLLQVTQKGNAASSQWRTRTFTYDSLSRLLTATNPETGLIQWTYNNDSNVLTKKDARNITITYHYDQLHRVATTGTTHAKTYSNGDAAVDYYFDQTSYNGLTIAEGTNHRTGMNDVTGQTAWTFDSEGRTRTEQRTINISGVTPSAVTKALNYSYNLDGSLASLTYPSGHVVNYSYNTAGRTISVIDPNGGSAINYVTWDCPKTGVYCYSPYGEELRLIRGATSSFAGIVTNNAFNSRLQPSQFVATVGSSNVLSLNFNFNLGVNDNGTLARIVNNVDSGRSKTFTYDQLNRIVSAVNDSTASNTSNWGNIYALDVWGDLYQKNPCDGTICPVKLYSDSLTVSVSNNKNQFDGYSYDSSGNLLNDQLGHAFTYDAENRPYAGGGANYYYDGEGERVAKSNGTLYLFGTGSAPVMETDLSGNLIAEYIFANGSRMATRKSSGSVYYYFADQVGSAQVVTGALGGVQQKIEYHPYGEETIITNSVTNNYRFTGKEHDSETNDDYFGARYYGSSFGRFLTPDWAATPVPNPYAVMGNPQTLNLYSYVENNPITGTDPDGHAGEGYTGNAGAWYDCLVHNCSGAKESREKQPPPPPPPPKQEDKSTPAQNQVTPQSLAAQVPADAKAAIMNGLNASNAPTADDKKGGFHEESVKWGTDASGNVVVSPSVPGAYAPPGTNPNTNFTPANPATDQKLVTVDGFAHIHPKGGGDRSFVQGPSAADLKFAGQSSAINLVVGAGDKKVYFFNGSGVIGKPMKLKDFMGD